MHDPQSRADPQLAGLLVLTMRQLREIIPYTPQHIYRLEKAGRFPRRRRMGPNRVVWLAAEVALWLKSLPVIEPEPPGDDDV